jgi:hypothetical protein
MRDFFVAFNFLSLRQSPSFSACEPSAAIGSVAVATEFTVVSQF